MKAVVKYFINNEIAGNILMILLFIVGIFGLNQMKTTFFPEVESRLISIQAIYPGSSPDEVEEGIVSKIEENLKGLTGIERVTSVSSENSASINVEVLKGFDTDVIVQDVKNAVDRVSSFPANMEPLIIFKRENLGFAINFSISGDVPLKTLKKIARQAEDDIRALEDVSKVELSGFPDEEIEITFREEDLRANNITFAEAASRIRQTNLEVTGGTIKTNTEELLIRANNKEYTAAAIQDIVIKSNPDGGVIRLYQVADVIDRFTDRPQRNFVDGDPAVVVIVQNTLEEDMLDVTDKVKKYLAEDFSKKFPEVEATVLVDGSITLRQRIDLLTSNGITGFIIVLILLAMFLHYRLAFWVALAIPISFAGMFICASIIGVTINVISLFGMIIVIGILVDDGIVIAENIYQHYEDGEPAFKAALNGTMEVLPAVFSAIITTVIAFSAFFFIDGRLGDFFREMAIVVIFSLVFSLVEGALILPAHIAHSKALSRDRKPNVVMRSLDKMMAFLKDNLYGPVLNWAVRFNWPTLAICFAGLFIVVGALMGGLIKSTFFPVIPRENFSVQLKLASGTREDITLDILNRIENAVLEVNEELRKEFFGDSINPIENIEKSIGPSTYQGSLNVGLLEGETRGDVTARVIIGKIREKVGPLPMAENFTFGGGSPFGKPLSLSLLGDDGDQLSAAVDAVKASLEKIPDLKDIVDNNQEGLKEIELELTPKAYNLGFTLNDIIGQVRQGFFGAEAQRIQRGEDEVRIWVRYGEEDRSDISDLADMRIRTADGQSVPLNELATFKTERGVININRIDGAREVRIEADVSNDQVSISDVTSDVRNVILPQTLSNFPGVVASFEGQEREQAKTRESMQLVMPIIFLMMFFVIILTFKSVSQALIVFTLLPFGFIGVGAGHYIHGLPISLFSILGVIALIGIFVNDALVFITTYNEKIKKGVPQQQAVIETGKSRFRPILLTSITTIAGLAPLILEKSFQAQFLIPMAISVAYGLLFGTFVLLVLIPALLMIVNRIKRTAIHIYEGEKPSRESVEPAYPGRESNFLAFLIAGVVAIGIFGMLVYGLFQFSSVFV